MSLLGLNDSQQLKYNSGQMIQEALRTKFADLKLTMYVLEPRAYPKWTQRLRGNDRYRYLCDVSLRRANAAAAVMWL